MSRMPAVAFALLILCLPTRGLGQTPTSPADDDGSRPSIGDVAFLAGCWSGGAGDVDMREQWSAAAGGVMLGTTRFFREEALVDWEFARIEETPDGVTLWPYPKGERSPRGFPLVSVGDELVFENLAHDFPVRIIYRPMGPDRVAPRIEGHGGEGPGWVLDRVACPS